MKMICTDEIVNRVQRFVYQNLFALFVLIGLVAQQSG